MERHAADRHIHPPTALAACLQQLREERGLTLLQLARQAGLAASFLLVLERGYEEVSGEPIIPDPRTLRRLAIGLEPADEARQGVLYLDLMETAGHWPYGSPPAPVPQTPPLTLTQIAARVAALPARRRTTLLRLMTNALEAMEDGEPQT